MRLTGGTFRGRTLETPKGQDIRPATDKVRQAVFNALFSRLDLEGATILDGFCGTGSYGLEALSRGGAFCTFVDKNRQSLALCRHNIEALGVTDRTQVVSADMLRVLPPSDRAAPVDLLFLDPPYRQGLLLPALAHLQKTGWISEATCCVLECEKDLQVPGGESRFYGEVQIVFMHTDAGRSSILTNNQ
ncbi:MAG: 16S rRNA (guanine(966)-N(2))-methyltransferase RsmD [Rhodospirillales bacterium]|nr:16S rRNA (guanine(966)-N(2))-methyltransferase RsmD [Rhodospirillales bacterium]MCB9965742.1 16S rRNA (guanine(966)-N(2))-methyltransferase RsmD [Rhodospirillales bacterium]MCB9979670.1 16S rRNA (guanine(966)-N(2))-methyltransferase RsmD [Rhodospirillales bacterium]